MTPLDRAHTRDTGEGVDVHVGVKLPGTQGLAGGHVARDALRRGAVGAHGRAQGSAVLRLRVFIVGGLLALLLVALSPADVVDAEQEAVVHDLQLHQELDEDTKATASTIQIYSPEIEKDLRN